MRSFLLSLSDEDYRECWVCRVRSRCFTLQSLISTHMQYNKHTVYTQEVFLPDTKVSPLFTKIHRGTLKIFTCLFSNRITNGEAGRAHTHTHTHTHTHKHTQIHTNILYINTLLCQQEWCKDSLLVSQGHHPTPFLTLPFYLSPSLCVFSCSSPYLSLSHCQYPTHTHTLSIPCQATHPNMRTYYFCTDTAKEMESWMKVMTDAALVHSEPVRRSVLTTAGGWRHPHR